MSNKISQTTSNLDMCLRMAYGTANGVKKFSLGFLAGLTNLSFGFIFMIFGGDFA